jgi:hypothetical protein
LLSIWENSVSTRRLTFRVHPFPVGEDTFLAC